jgi:CHASE1-domain containing sensor protein
MSKTISQMETALIWVPLVSVVLSVLLTSGSTMLVQRHADRRDAARRQLERERENAARSYEHRRDAYVDFIKESYRLWNAFEEASAGGKFDAPAEYLVPLYDRVIQVQIFGTREAAKLAEKAFENLSDGVFLGDDPDPTALKLLRNEIRRDLSIPDRPF